MGVARGGVMSSARRSQRGRARRVLSAVEPDGDQTGQDRADEHGGDVGFLVEDDLHQQIASGHTGELREVAPIRNVGRVRGGDRHERGILRA